MVSGPATPPRRIRARSALAAALSLCCAVMASGAPAAPLDPATVAGVYKTRFQNGDVDGRTYTSEDILEIVPLSPTTAYFKSYTNFYNGHSCSISGVGDVRDDALLYVDRSGNTTATGEVCRLALRVSAAKITFEDEAGACKDHCGARGSLDGTAVERRTRRTIRYMKLLRGSDDFRRALAEHDGGDPGPSAPR